MKTAEDRCGIILLAAGASTRLGLPKQLLSYRGTSLIRHVVSVALQSRARPVVVVLGAGHEFIIKEIDDLRDVVIVVNDQWKEGIASSIRAGIAHLNQIAHCDGMILAVCDQPHINAALLDGLILRQEEGKHPIVASAYGDTIGTPALFHRQFFDQLLSLSGDTGAKRIITKNIDRVTDIPFPGGETDIDTPAEYDALPRDQRK